VRFFLQNQLAALQFADPPLVGSDHRGALCRDDPVEHLGDLVVDHAGLPHQIILHVPHGRGLPIPEVFEDGTGERKQLRRGRELTEQSLKLSLDLIARNGLAVSSAALLSADVIGIGLARALRPIGGELMPAIPAKQVASQREVIAHIQAIRRTCLAQHPILDALEGLKADEALVLCPAQGYAPARQLQIPCIERLHQDFSGAFVDDLAVPALFEVRAGFKKASDFGLRFEAA
jgi:hypothetical protein